MKNNWWKESVVYQIYPQSFMDSNGDGIGDFNGIIQKLDYLQNLGVDVLWICPMYASPLVDNGYDISDYYKVNPIFGTNEDMEHLIEEAQKRKIKIILDLVVNHCSDQHEWFQKAMKDPNCEEASYFYFRTTENDKEPNNWRSNFGGSVWSRLPDGRWYYHTFAKEQPDLNWNNPRLKKELFDMVNWWLEKGVAGFRIDAIINIKKDTAFPDYPADGADGLVSCTKMVEEVDGVGELLEELKKETFEKYGAFTVAEVFNMKEDELREFIGDDGHFSTMFDFSAAVLSEGDKGWHTGREVTFGEWRSALFESQLEGQKVGFKANIIENHDEPRGASRYLPSYAQNPKGIKMLGTTSVLLRGIPFIYQGQELGMTNCRFDSIEEYDDISTKDQYKVALEAGLTAEEALEAVARFSRDNSRTPMQWSGERNAGFTTGKPWLKVNPNYIQVNAAEEEKDAASVLQYYRQLIALRKSDSYREAFTYGEFRPAFEDEKGIFAFTRSTPEQKILVAANYGTGEQVLELPSGIKKLLLSNNAEIKSAGNRICLGSCDAAVLELE